MGQSRMQKQLWLYLLIFAVFIIVITMTQAFEADLKSALERYARSSHSRDIVLILIKMALWSGLSIVLVRALNTIVFGTLFRLRRGYEAPNLIRNLFSIVAYAVAFVIIFKSFFPRIELTPLLATSTIFGVIIGLALQETMGNLFAGISLHADKPFLVGDVITVGQRSGVVESISWRAVKIRTFQNHVILVSNSSIAKEAIEVCPRDNLNASIVTFNTLCSDSPARTIHVVREAVRDADNVHPDMTPVVRIRNFGDSSMDWEVKYWPKDYAGHNDTDALIRQRIWYAFRRAGIQLAFPTRTLHIEGRKRGSGEQARLGEYAEMISVVDLFALLSADEVARLAKACIAHIFAPGETVIRAGNPGDSMFVIRKGHVHVQISDNGKIRTIANLGEGDFFGEMALLTGEPRSANVVAADETEVLEIGHDAMKQLFETNPDLVASLSGIIEERRTGLQARQASAVAVAEGSGGIIALIKRFFGLG